MKKIQPNSNIASKFLNGIVTKVNAIIDKLIVDVKVNGESVVTVNEDGEREADIDLSLGDQNVKQSPTTDNKDYRILLSKSDNDTEETDIARKNTNLKYNPSTGNLQATKLNGNTIPSGSGTDTLAKTSDIPDMTNYIQKSLTSGLIKNDGTIDQSDYVESSDLATVATSGSYNDLIDKPTIPAGQVQSDWEQDDDTEVDYIKHKPTLADVATSGDYSDLLNTPTIPTVNDGKLTINQNGALKGEFTANDSDDVTVNLTDENVKQIADTATSWRRLALVENNNTEKSSNVFKNSSFWCCTSPIGTTSTVGKSFLAVGNNTSSGTDGNSKGYLRIYGENNKRSQITINGSVTADREVYLPNKDGTIALTDDIPTKTSDLTNDSNFVSDANYVHTDVNFTSAYETKLSGIEPNAQVNTVTGVKGSGETDYRTGNISISKSDVGLGSVPNVTTNNQKPTFTQASTRANLVSNTDTLSTIMGKIMKWFDDLKDLAFIAKDGTSSTKYLRGDGQWITFPTIPTITDTYSGTSHDGMSGVAVKSAIDALDGNLNNTTPSASKTLTAFSQTDGKVSAKFENISISKSQAGLGNVDNTSDETKKTNFTGSIASGNTGFVKGGDIYTALQGKADTGDIPTDFVKASTGGTFSGNITVAKSHTGTTDNQTILTVGNNKTSTGMSSGALKLFSERGTGKFIRLFNDNTLTGSGADRRYKLPVDKPNDSELAVVADIPTQATDIGALPNTTKYAASSSVGGSAISAVTAEKLSNTSKVGDTNRPVYFTAGGVPAQISYTIDKSVPSNAVFTDTKVTTSGNHYAPSTVSGEDESASASGATAAWGIDVVKGVTLNTDGKGHVTGISVTSGKIPSNPVSALDVAQTSVDANKTIATWKETDGKVAITTQDISITKSQVSDFPSTMPPSSHTHGNIQNDGKLQTTDVTIASGDKIVVTDSSDSDKLARTSISFNGSTTTKALSQKGTWESYLRLGSGGSVTANTTFTKNLYLTSKSGDGVLAVRKWNGDDTTVDITSDTNGVTATTRYNTLVRGIDINTKRMCEVQSTALQNGNTGIVLSVSNYYQNVDQTAPTVNHADVFNAQFSKTGTLTIYIGSNTKSTTASSVAPTYSIRGNANFRTALGFKGNPTWSKYASYTGTGNKAMMVANDYNELFFCVHIDEENVIDMTIPMPIPAITATSSSTPQQIRQGYNYATTAFGFVSINVWIASSKVYCKLNQVFQNNTTNKASTTSYDVYYR